MSAGEPVLSAPCLPLSAPLSLLSFTNIDIGWSFSLPLLLLEIDMAIEYWMPAQSFSFHSLTATWMIHDDYGVFSFLTPPAPCLPFPSLLFCCHCH